MGMEGSVPGLWRTWEPDTKYTLTPSAPVLRDLHKRGWYQHQRPGGVLPHSRARGQQGAEWTKGPGSSLYPFSHLHVNPQFSQNKRLKRESVLPSESTGNMLTGSSPDPSDGAAPPPQCPCPADPLLPSQGCPASPLPSEQEPNYPHMRVNTYPPAVQLEWAAPRQGEGAGATPPSAGDHPRETLPMAGCSRNPQVGGKGWMATAGVSSRRGPRAGPKPQGRFPRGPTPPSTSVCS